MSMYCNQCQETAGNLACKIKGVCGKNDSTANLQDELILSLQKIAITSPKIDSKIGELLTRSLFATITNANFDDAKIQQIIDETKNYPQANLPPKSTNEDIISLKQIILYGLKGLAAYTHHAYILGKENFEIYEFVVKALQKIATSEDVNELINLTLETGKIAVSAMALLDLANTSKYGNPEISEVNIEVKNNPGILISGHDLLDLELLLEQTKNSGVDVYTHSEMLPANYYPFFKKYKNLVGNYGNAWWKQNDEFEKFNGPILMTTNCIIPPKDSYKNRIFTTGVVGYPGVKHISNKDFTQIIELAKTCPPPTQIESGK